MAKMGKSGIIVSIAVALVVHVITWKLLFCLGYHVGFDTMTRSHVANGLYFGVLPLAIVWTILMIGWKRWDVTLRVGSTIVVWAFVAAFYSWMFVVAMFSAT